MISKTALIAFRTLVHMGTHRDNVVRSPRKIAEALGESATYLAKVTRLLVKADILRAEKGARGGVYLRRAPHEITLLDIVEACQGAIAGDFCKPGCDKKMICSYHVAAEELRAAIVGVLSQWTLANLMERPSSPKLAQLTGVACLMAGGQQIPAAMR